MAVAKLDLIDQFEDNTGELLNGGLVYFYAGGTTTPLSTYADSTGNTPNTHPVVLDSAGRAEIWLTKGLSYKVILADADDVVLETVDNVVIFDDETVGAGLYYYPTFSYEGGDPPETDAFLGKHVFRTAVEFPADWAGAGGHADVNPTAAYTITIKKNGAECGSVSIATNGTFTFTSTGGATVPFAIADRMTLHGQTVDDDTLNQFAITFRGVTA